MTVMRKIGAHNRSSGAIAGKRMRQALGLPKGSGFCVPIPLHLLESHAWAAQSSQCRKFIDVLMAEHAAHGGAENGNLKAPYTQLRARGIRGEIVLDVVMEAKALGIADHVRGQRSYGSKRAPSEYRLTWLGTPDGLPPTNEWKSIKSPEEAIARKTNAREALARERAIKRARRAERLARQALVTSDASTPSDRRSGAA
jgi:hypothetical protein